MCVCVCVCVHGCVVRGHGLLRFRKLSVSAIRHKEENNLEVTSTPKKLQKSLTPT